MSYIEENLKEYLRNNPEALKNVPGNNLGRMPGQKALEIKNNLDAAEEPDILTDYSQLPNRNTELLPYLGEQFINPAGALAKTGDYIYHAAERPQNAGEFALSWLAGTGEGVGEYILSKLGLGPDEEKKTPTKTWLERYLETNGGGGGGGAGLGGPEMYTPEALPSFSVNFRAPETKDLKAPTYEGTPYNKWDVIAAGLANADFSGDLPDFSRAVNEMNRITDEGKRSVTDAKNRTAEAQAEFDRWKFTRDLAIEEARMKSAYMNANLAMARQQAMAPKALGGNKFYWRDSNGNMHWDSLDKNGEARVLGQNAAFSDFAGLSDKEISKLTPQQIMRKAQQQSLLLQDKNAQVPFMQNYYLSAMSLLPQEQ